MEGDKNSSVGPQLSIILIGIASAAFVVAIYHCIAVGWCKRQQTTHSPQWRPRTFTSEEVNTQSSIENPTVLLFPAHKYQKGLGLPGEDGTCAVCLSEFEEGEELRTLPECMHSFHVPCIDMWLYSRANCPMCRADASPSPQLFRGPSDYGSGGLEMQHDQSTMLPYINVQSDQTV